MYAAERTIKKRWGLEEIIHQGQYMLKRITLDECTSMHFHYAKHETLFCLAGHVLIEFEDGREVTLDPGDWLVIPEGKRNAHRMTGPAVYLEASTPQQDDSERIQE